MIIVAKHEEDSEIRNHHTSNKDVFSKNSTDLGRTHLTEHRTESGDAFPIKLSPCRVPLAFIGYAEEVIHKYLDQGTAHPSTSTWAAPVH